jgi:hypothetical protein
MYGKIDFNGVSFTYLASTRRILKSDGTYMDYTADIVTRPRHIGRTDDICTCATKFKGRVYCTCLYSHNITIKVSNDIIYKLHDFADRYIIHYVNFPDHIILIDNYGALYMLCIIFPEKLLYFNPTHTMPCIFTKPLLYAQHDQHLTISSIYSANALPIICIYKLKQINIDAYNFLYSGQQGTHASEIIEIEAKFMEQYVNCMMMYAFPSDAAIKFQYQCINMGPDGFRCKFMNNSPDAVCKDCQYLIHIAQTLPCGIMKEHIGRCCARSSIDVFGLFICAECHGHMTAGNPIIICPKFEIKCQGNSECLANATNIYTVPLCAGHLKRAVNK